MRPALAAVIATAVLAVPAVARAGVWYYAWRCSGQCAPNQLAITGEEGPFLTYADCEGARSRDGRAQAFVGPGNLGGLDNCAERDGTAVVVVQPRTTILQRVRASAVGGYGWHVEDSSGADTRGGPTAGLDFEAVFGPHPNFGFEIGTGVQRFSVTAPVYNNTSRTMFIYPWALGLTSTPSLWRGRLRLDLAADILYLYRYCSGCNDGATNGYGARVRGGFDFYWGDYALGIAGLWLWASLGSVGDAVAPTAAQINAPAAIGEISFTWRNPNISW